MIDIFDDIKDIVFGNQRLNQIKDFGQQHHFGYSRRVSMNDLPAVFESVEFFKGERKKSIKGFLYRSELDERAIGYIYDYLYYSEFGRKTTTVFHFKIEKLNLPYFIVKPRSGLHKISSIFNSTEWNELDKNFDNQFTVASDNMNFMRMNLTIQFAEILLRHKTFAVEGLGDHLFVYDKNNTIDIDKFIPIYKDGLELLDIILH
jgi:hypothetical protein